MHTLETSALQMRSDQLVPGRAHRIVKQRAHWHSHHADACSRFRPFRGARHDVVQDLQHVTVVAYLPVPGLVASIWRLPWYLLKHLHKVHVYLGVALNELLELLDRRRELSLLRGLNFLGYIRKVLAVNAVVSRKPCAWPVSRQFSISSSQP